MTLDAQGDPNAVWIFKMGSTLITDAGTSIVLAGNAQAGNIFWQVGSSATLGVNSVFDGNDTGRCVDHDEYRCNLHGRALTRDWRGYPGHQPALSRRAGGIRSESRSHRRGTFPYFRNTGRPFESVEMYDESIIAVSTYRDMLIKRRHQNEKTILMVLLLGVFLLALATPGFAENQAKTMTLDVFTGGYQFDEHQQLDLRSYYGLRAGYNFTKIVGVGGHCRLCPHRDPIAGVC